MYKMIMMLKFYREYICREYHEDVGLKLKDIFGINEEELQMFIELLGCLKEKGIDDL